MTNDIRHDNDMIATAIAYTDATQLGVQYIYCEGDETYRVTRDELIELGELIADADEKSGSGNLCPDAAAEIRREWARDHSLADRASDDIAGAINKLSATELPGGDYAYLADETKLYYVVSAADVEDLGRRMFAGELDEYSLWCAVTDAEEMPAGWDPSYHGIVVIALSAEDSEYRAVVTAIADDVRFRDPDFSGVDVLCSSLCDFTAIYGADEIAGAQLLSRVRSAIAESASGRWKNSQATTLVELLAEMQADTDDEMQWDELPTFGGDEPADTVGVWSWDETHMIVGECPRDVEIVARNAAEAS